MLYQKNTTNEEGICCNLIEETCIYTLENKAQHENLVNRLNNTLGFAAFSVENTTYPHTFATDAQEMLDMKENIKKQGEINYERNRYDQH